MYLWKLGFPEASIHFQTDMDEDKIAQWTPLAAPISVFAQADASSTVSRGTSFLLGTGRLPSYLMQMRFLISANVLELDEIKL